jgi:hypothetical protein
VLCRSFARQRPRNKCTYNSTFPLQKFHCNREIVFFLRSPKCCKQVELGVSLVESVGDLVIELQL